MDKIIKEETSYISKEGKDQNILRMFYSAIRRHDLSISKDTPRGESLKKAIGSVRKQSPNFTPLYDTEFFKMDEV